MTRPTPRPTTRAILRPSTGATTRPATQPSTRPATRPLGGADGAAAEFIRGLERREEALLARVIAPGDDETPADRARSTLAGAGSFRGIAGIVRGGTKIWIGNVEAGVPVDGRAAARVQLLRTGKRGDERSAGSLQLTRFDDGWRVRDWDMPH